MKTLSAFLGMLLLMACTTPEDRKRDQLMDVIEAQVKLPQGARALSDYARHYAVDEKGLIIAVYAPGYRPLGPEEGCEELLPNMTTRPVPCEEFENDRLLAGQRQWVSSPLKLPLINDGGCDVVNVVYNPEARKVESVSCNGPA